MMSTEPNDPIDILLRAQDSYIKDDGFTARVVASLPRRRRYWLRPTLLLGTTTICSILTVRWFPWDHLPALDSSVLLSLNSSVLMPWIIVISVIASLCWGITGAIAEE